MQLVPNPEIMVPPVTLQLNVPHVIEVQKEEVSPAQTVPKQQSVSMVGPSPEVTTITFEMVSIHPHGTFDSPCVPGTNWPAPISVTVKTTV